MHNIISRPGDRVLKNACHVFLIATVCINSYMRCADNLTETYPTLNRVALHKKIAQYEQLSQEQKNEELLAIVRKGYPYTLHHKYRKKIAALAHAGADVPAVQLKTTGQFYTLLPDITFTGDLELVQLLIDKKANINEQCSSFNHSAIYNAYTIPLTQLLIDNHALDALSAQQKQGLFDRLMWDLREPELINVYKKYGLDAMNRNESGNTLLMILPKWTTQGSDMLKKAVLLLADLSTSQIRRLLAIKNNNNETVFDIIDFEASYSSVFRKDVYALRDFLKQRTDPAKYPDNPQTVALKVENQPEVAATECSVCLQPLDEQICITTKCNHIFHTNCLNIWVNKNHSCPLCRALV